jgi:hypothetical protein
MIRKRTSAKEIKTVGLTVTLGLVGLALTAQASAACMDNPLRQVSPPTSVSPMHFVPAVYRPTDTSAASLLPVSDWDNDNDGIVGLWQFHFAGFSVDWGTQAWHSDGTEITFSGGQNPETGDVCQGVWRKIGHSTYTLNHIAMGWLAPGAGFGTRVHLHFVVRLDHSGNAFSGTYRATVYSVSPTDPFDESVELASGTGTVTATRVLPD